MESEPVDHGLPGHGWTIPKLLERVKQIMGKRPARNTLRSMLRRHGLRWKKCKKVLGKADPAKRAAFIAQFQTLFEEVCADRLILIYVDEAHIHRDMDLGYTWAAKERPAWRLSSCPPLSDRINWYGAYNFTEPDCFIWNEGACNKDHTILFLERLADEIGPTDKRKVIIWDNAPWHRAKDVRKKAKELGFELIFLPGYSPDLNPIEGLWKWMREEVTKLKCYDAMRDLFLACLAFIERINQNRSHLLNRLWPKFELDPDFEKLLVSK